MGCEHAGHCNPAASGWRAAVRPLLRRSFPSEPGRGVGDATAGRAPGSRMWQCGQCSGPASRLRRHSGQVMVGTLQCISSEALARRDADASLKTGWAVNPTKRSSSPRQQADGIGRVLRAMDHTRCRSRRLTRYSRWEYRRCQPTRSERAGGAKRPYRPQRRDIGGWTAIGAAALAQVATCDGRSTLRH
jgi:hypothetical protein